MDGPQWIIHQRRVLSSPLLLGQQHFVFCFSFSTDLRGGQTNLAKVSGWVWGLKKDILSVLETSAKLQITKTGVVGVGRAMEMCLGRWEVSHCPSVCQQVLQQRWLGGWVQHCAVLSRRRVLG